LSSSGPCWRKDRPAQKELGQPVPRPQLVGLGIVACPDQVAQRLARLIGDPDRRQITTPQQAGELGRVPAVGLHPVARLGPDERGGATTMRSTPSAVSGRWIV